MNTNTTTIYYTGDMNYRTTFDTEHIPTNTKKNIEKLNNMALQREQEMSSRADSGKQGMKQDVPRVRYYIYICIVHDIYTGSVCIYLYL